MSDDLHAALKRQRDAALDAAAINEATAIGLARENQQLKTDAEAREKLLGELRAELTQARADLGDRDGL